MIINFILYLEFFKLIIFCLHFLKQGRVVFGNRLVPTTLSIQVEEAHIVYSTKPAASRLDHFMHFAKCKAENFKVFFFIRM